MTASGTRWPRARTLHHFLNGHRTRDRLTVPSSIPSSSKPSQEDIESLLSMCGGKSLEEFAKLSGPEVMKYVLDSRTGKSPEQLERDKSILDKLSAMHSLPSVGDYTDVLDSAASSIRSFQTSQFATTTSENKWKSSKQGTRATALSNLDGARATEKRALSRALEAYAAVGAVCPGPDLITLQRLRDFRESRGPVASWMSEGQAKEHDRGTMQYLISKMK